MSTTRLSHLDRILQSHELDAFALVPGPNLRYLTGLTFHLMERPILGLFMREQPPRLVVPELERVKIEDARLEAELFDYGEQEGASASAFQRMIEAVGMEEARVGVEAANMRYLELSLLQAAAPGFIISSASHALAELRLIKEEHEIRAMESAAAIAERALEATLPLIQPGMTEEELASEVALQLLRAGSEPETPFSPIIASGPNSALPHATPTQRKLQPGDLLILDWGATHQGYVSDITRTFAIGDIEPEMASIHRIVQQANTAGRETARPGELCEGIDRAARAVIEAAGYGEAFIHRTGHGLGMEAHEAPFIRSGETLRLEPGMTFTVEPGIYLSGRGGARVEDDLVITQQGARSLTSFPRQLQVVGA